MSTIAQVTAARIVPIVTVDDAARSHELADALLRGRLTSVEITLRTSAGLAAIEAFAKRGDILVGAGTVLTPQQVDESADRGAQFIVSPGYDPDVVRRAQERGLLALPGVATATEVQRAVRDGLTHLKLFPAETLGGLSLISALAAPFPGVSYMPSGGISATNIEAYLGHPAVFAVGASWMVPRDAIREGRFDDIAELCAVAAGLASRR